MGQLRADDDAQLSVPAALRHCYRYNLTDGYRYREVITGITGGGRGGRGVTIANNIG